MKNICEMQYNWKEARGVLDAIWKQDVDNVIVCGCFGDVRYLYKKEPPDGVILVKKHYL